MLLALPLAALCLLALPDRSPARSPDAGSSLPRLAYPGPERASLEIPLEIWEIVRESAGANGRPIGYDAQAMAHYGRSTFLLPAVLQLFGDARTVPRFSGKISTDLLADAGKAAAFGYGWEQGGLGEMAARCYGLLGTSTGRMVMPDTLDPGTPPFGLDPEAAGRWSDLPPPIRDLVVRLYLAADRTRPWLLASYDLDLLSRIAGVADPAAIRTRDLHAVAMAHQEDERFDQLATLRADTFRLFETVDLAYQGYATVVWLRYVEFALKAFREAGGTESFSGRRLETFRIGTPLGEILIGGTGDDDHRSRDGAAASSPFLALDLGGNDLYGPGLAAPAALASPVAILLDLDGNDRYIAAEAADAADPAVLPSFGAGIFGIGALFDLAGDDEYAAAESALGRGCFGSGILVDFGGDDSYHGGRWTQGAAHAGIGLLVDLDGSDRYSCAEQSQGMGATKGTGLLLDLAGNDRYVARDDGNVSALYLGQSVAMSQGCGYGRRADLGDGHSLAGGFGLLIDGAGDDDYHAQVWSQGCAYWWAVGILEDRGGDDRYRNGKYSSGAAAHFGVGLHVDLEGNDIYNEGNDTAKNQFQGHARDGSIGIFLDGDGDDRYELRSHCGGSGDLGSIGLFWDRRGHDAYRYDAPPAGEGDWAETPPLGSTTRYDPFHSFRDDLPVYGIFLDTGGVDRYETGGVGGDGRVWTMRRYAGAWGVGIDGEAY